MVPKLTLFPSCRRRSIEVVKLLEDDKEQMERTLQRTRDKARQLKEKSAIQLAREQGRRIGYEEGLEKGRLVAQMQALAASRIQDSSDSQGIQAATGALRRALTQGPNDSTSHRHSSRIRHNSLDQQTRRSSGDGETVTRPNVRQSSADNATSASQVQESPTTAASASRPVVPAPSREEHVPPEFLQQVRSDASRGSAGSRDNTTPRPTISGATEIPQPLQPPPPGVFTQARSDASQSSGSGSSSVKSRRTASSSVRRASAPQQQNGSDRPAEQLNSIRPTRPLETTSDRYEPPHRPRQRPSDAFPSTFTTSQARKRDPAPYPGVPPAKQFPAGIPRDDISVAATSPTSSVDEIDIVAHPPATRPPSVIFAPQPPQPPPVDGGSSRRARERPPPIDDVRPVIPENTRPASRTGGPGAAPSPSVQHSHGPVQPPPMPPLSPHIQVPQWFVFPPPDQSAVPVGGTSTPILRHQDPHHFLSPASPASPAFTGGGTGSNRSSLSFEFQVVPPVSLSFFWFPSTNYYGSLTPVRPPSNLEGVKTPISSAPTADRSIFHLCNLNLNLALLHPRSLLHTTAHIRRHHQALCCPYRPESSLSRRYTAHRRCDRSTWVQVGACQHQSTKKRPRRPGSSTPLRWGACPEQRARPSQQYQQHRQEKPRERAKSEKASRSNHRRRMAIILSGLVLLRAGFMDRSRPRPRLLRGGR